MSELLNICEHADTCTGSLTWMCIHRKPHTCIHPVRTGLETVVCSKSVTWGDGCSCVIIKKDNNEK